MQLTADTAAAWGLALSAHQLAQLAAYAAELRSWNERLNLTAVTEPLEIERRHFLDSLACAFAWPGPPPASMVDVGSGAGFPGLPLKILWPAAQLTLIESIGKKATFLRHVADELGLAGVEVLTVRAEAAGHDPALRERADLALARAVAALPALAEYCLPLVRVGGRLLAPKGHDIVAEVDDALAAIDQLGGGLAGIYDVEIPGLDPRSLVAIDKLRPTPAAYPRPPGVPTRRPQ